MQHGYNLGLVMVSYAMSVFGSFVALMLAAQVRDLHRSMDRVWLAGAAMALGGGGIWAMHFIAMLAFDMGMPVAYDVSLTLGSLVTGVVFTGAGFFLVHGSQSRSMAALSLAGVIMGCGVAGMHYMGMAGMRMAADLQYDPTIVAVSIVIAVVASTVALWLAFNLKKGWHKLVAAFVMGAAVCGMHYTAMTGTKFVPAAAQVDFFQGAFMRQDLDSTVVMATVSLLALGVVLAFAKELSHASTAE